MRPAQLTVQPSHRTSKISYCYLIYLCIFSFQISSVQATSSENYTELTQQLIKQNTDQKRAWHNLLHYRPNLIAHGYTSQADDSLFFLSKKGKTNPKAELIAFSEALQNNQSAQIQCQFPARYYWVKKQFTPEQWLKLNPKEDASCPEFDVWKNKLNANKVTLVLASSYLNSPSSMFGHTFLRLDSADQDKTNLLLSYTISYAADEGQHDNEMMFAYKGIFGGYPGITSVESYYDKIKMYSSLENRDLWEYQLNLTNEETSQLIRHTWEIRDKQFDYYFFDENCAYRLLALIDVARPGTELLDEISLRAIPSDTVKLAVEKGLVKQVIYRPSAANKLATKINQLTPQEANQVQNLASQTRKLNDFIKQTPNQKSQARVLDSTFEYLRYQASETKSRQESAAELSHRILVARSRINASNEFSETPYPNVRNDQGHPTMRYSLAAGRQADNNYMQLSLRPAYHDLTDPIDGFTKGSELQFLNTDIRYYNNQQVELENIIIVDIRSLTPRDKFFNPVSWQVSFGGHRINEKRHDQLLSPYLNGGAGLSYSLGSSTVYGIGGGELNLSSHLAKGMKFGPLFQLGWLWQQPNSQTLIELSSQSDWIGQAKTEYKAFFSQSIPITTQWSVNLNASRSKIFDQFENDIQLGIRFYH